MTSSKKLLIVLLNSYKLLKATSPKMLVEVIKKIEKNSEIKD